MQTNNNLALPECSTACESTLSVHHKILRRRPMSVMEKQIITTPCKMCRERYSGGRPESFGSDPKCAFPDGGPFTPDNWQCVTANAIRDIAEAERDGVICDWSAGGAQSSAVIRIDNDYPVGFDAITDAHCLFVTWYKRRGRTGGMWLIGDEDNGAPRSPTEAEALAIIAHYAPPPSTPED